MTNGPNEELWEENHESVYRILLKCGAIVVAGGLPKGELDAVLAWGLEHLL